MNEEAIPLPPQGSLEPRFWRLGQRRISPSITAGGSFLFARPPNRVARGASLY